MVRDLNFPLEVVVCPIVREPDGLAMSSRNVYLDPEQRKAATVLFRSLSAAKEAYEDGERNAENIRGKMKEVLASESLADVQYVSCANYDTLEELDVIKGKALLSMAVFFGKTRLIDNFIWAAKYSLLSQSPLNDYFPAFVSSPSVQRNQKHGSSGADIRCWSIWTVS